MKRKEKGTVRFLVLLWIKKYLKKGKGGYWGRRGRRKVIMGGLNTPELRQKRKKDCGGHHFSTGLGILNKSL